MNPIFNTGRQLIPSDLKATISNNNIGTDKTNFNSATSGNHVMLFNIQFIFRTKTNIKQ